jgi:hypothetical protein
MEQATGRRELNAPARIAGFAWLVVIMAGISAEFFLRMPMIVQGDAAATAANIMEAEGRFRLSIAADIVMLLFDVTATVALYCAGAAGRAFALVLAVGKRGESVVREKGGRRMKASACALIAVPVRRTLRRRAGSLRWRLL